MSTPRTQEELYAEHYGTDVAVIIGKAVDVRLSIKAPGPDAQVTIHMLDGGTWMTHTLSRSEAELLASTIERAYECGRVEPKQGLDNDRPTLVAEGDF